MQDDRYVLMLKTKNAVQHVHPFTFPRYIGVPNPTLVEFGNYCMVLIQSSLGTSLLLNFTGTGHVGKRMAQ